MATIGSIEPYDPSSGDWEAYQERLEMFLDANAVAEGQRVATLLTVIGGTAYKIVRNLVAPASPKDKTYTELMDALSAHFSPKPFVIAGRYRFHKRDQLPGESIATYVAELRRFARHCNFASTKNLFLCCSVLLSYQDVRRQLQEAKQSLATLQNLLEQGKVTGPALTRVNALLKAAIATTLVFADDTKKSDPTPLAKDTIREGSLRSIQPRSFFLTSKKPGRQKNEPFKVSNAIMAGGKMIVPIRTKMLYSIPASC